MLNTKSAAAVRLALAIAYPLLAHVASDRHQHPLAALALADIAVIVLWRPLLSQRAWAWAWLVAIAATLSWLALMHYALPVLLLAPAAIIGLAGVVFARTLRTVPLITRMVAALDGIPPADLSPQLHRYTRNLTAAWAGLLATLALLNLAAAMLAVPNGLLASVGITAPLAITQAQWSWVGVFNVGIMIGFFLIEFAIRQRRFPGRYKNLLDFLQRMARLGPAFWRDVAH